MTYTQAALVFEAAPSSTDGIAATNRAAHTNPLPRAHTQTPSNRRLPDDLWGEYRLECAMREQFHLPEMSLAEFRDLRDWVDGIEETDNDDDRIAHPNILPYGNHP